MEKPPSFELSRSAMLKRSVRFTELKESDDGFPDSKTPGCERILCHMIGGNAPPTEFMDWTMRDLKWAGVQPAGRA